MTTLRSRKRAPLVVGALVAVSALLFGCAGAEPNEPETSADQVLVVGLPRQLTGLEPGTPGSVDGDASVQGAIFSALTYVDPNLELQPDLAESWEQISDTEWMFYLHDDIKFSNGDDLTAADVEWTLGRLLDPEAMEYTIAVAIRAIIASVEAVDDTTVKITTNAPYVDLAKRLSVVRITQQGWVESNNATLEPLGSGPYMLQDLDLENGATLVKNPYYFGEEPYFDTVEYRVLASAASRVAAIQAGDVGVAVGLDPQTQSQFDGDADYETGMSWSTRSMVLRFNEDNNVALQDVRVRQAINFAVDKEAITESIFGGAVDPSPGQALVPGYDMINPDLDAYPYDPERAVELLEEAGYADGLELSWSVASGAYMASESIAQIVAQQLAEVGVTVDVTNEDFSSWQTRMRDPEQASDLFYVGASYGYQVPAEQLRVYGSSFNFSHFSDPDYDEMVTELAAATTVEEQQLLVNQITEHAFENPHVVYLWPQPASWVIDTGLAWTPRPEGWLLAQEFSSR